MKAKISVSLFIFSNIYSLDLENIRYTHSLVLVREPSRGNRLDDEDETSEHIKHGHIKICPLETLTDHQIAINKMPKESKTLENEYLSMLHDDVVAELEPCPVEEDEESVRSRKSACGFKIKDTNGTTLIFVFKGGNETERYQAWIIPNQSIDLFVGQMSEEIEKDGDRILSEKVELPYIPFPPFVTRAIVKVMTFVLLTYFSVKEKAVNFYNKVYDKYLKQHNEETEQLEVEPKA